MRRAAMQRWPRGQLPVIHRLQIVVVYYHEGVTIRMDNDNMLKPIQDALNGLVYVDDRQITDTQVRKTNLDGSFRVRGMSPILAAAFTRGSEFLHVRIEEAPDHTELVR